MTTSAPITGPTPRAGSLLPALRIDADPARHVAHRVHAPDRTWTEIICCFDLRIEVLHGRGLDPVPSIISLLSADHDGMRSTPSAPQ